jgi:protein AroM
MKKKIIALTIGHSPRNDIVPELEQISGSQFEFIQCGGLDGLEEAEILRKQDEIEGEYLVTKINTGKMIRTPREFAVNRMKNCFDKGFQEGAEAGVILCTLESFEELTSNKVIIKPQQLMLNFVKTIASNKRLGVIFPANDLVDVAIANWTAVSPDVFVRVYSANEPVGKLLNLVEEFSDLSVDVIILDCIGYTVSMKERVQKECGGIPVILPRTLIISALNELF